MTAESGGISRSLLYVLDVINAPLIIVLSQIQRNLAIQTGYKM